ncbi:uncharacterized protein A4U43_C04F32410 [Asparagus officinalis]|uniref:Uncharacterized protein n=1 Tax=Asparagus officinalis TaxID=4686 RepID=A0A5P1F6Z1_ASPOF|nr:uncharacterized protein A4U43_C04F32410 [Asparagus officinalis]
MRRRTSDSSSPRKPPLPRASTPVDRYARYSATSVTDPTPNLDSLRLLPRRPQGMTRSDADPDRAPFADESPPSRAPRPSTGARPRRVRSPNRSPTATRKSDARSVTGGSGGAAAWGKFAARDTRPQPRRATAGYQGFWLAGTCRTAIQRRGGRRPPGATIVAAFRDEGAEGSINFRQRYPAEESPCQHRQAGGGTGPPPAGPPAKRIRRSDEQGGARLHSADASSWNGGI